MNPLTEMQKTRPEKRALLLAIVWLVVISLARFQLTSGGQTSEHLKIGYLPITCHLLLPIAMERDEFFKRHVEPIKFTSWPDMIEAVKGGRLDCALILAPIAISLAAQRVPIEVALLGHRNGTGLVVARGGPIHGPRDFEGKTVAIPIRFSTQNLALLSFLEDSGVDIQKVTRVELPPPDMPSALASGAIDAYIVGEPYATQSVLAGTGVILRDIREIWPNFISSILIVRKDALDGKRAKLDTLIRGLYNQGKWIDNHRAEAARIGARFFGLSPKLIGAVLLGGKVSYEDILPREEEFSQIASRMKRHHLLEHVPRLEIYRGWK
ncbi:MAG: ABC transporter substrate-binding protein [Thermodesulfobacteria bacterium]|nr:ABC transporter substrate-binding protein [Thermodesulfobacteriota bacterium]